MIKSSLPRMRGLYIQIIERIDILSSRFLVWVLGECFQPSVRAIFKCKTTRGHNLLGVASAS